MPAQLEAGSTDADRFSAALAARQCHAPCCVHRLAHHVCAGRQVNVALIVLFNYYYTFLQLDPKDMADQLKRSGASIPAVRPGRATADYITNTLNRMSILGSAFLGALAAAPPLVEAVTKLQVRRALQACLNESKQKNGSGARESVPSLTSEGPTACRAVPALVSLVCAPGAVAAVFSGHAAREVSPTLCPPICLSCCCATVFAGLTACMRRARLAGQPFRWDHCMPGLQVLAPAARPGSGGLRLAGQCLVLA